MPDSTDRRPKHRRTRGFALPVVLVVAGALLILAVGALLIIGIERGTARSFADRQRADLAARAGLEEIRAILNAETGNDDYIIQQRQLPEPTSAGRDKSAYLFLTRGMVDDGTIKYRHVPLVSTVKQGAKDTLLPDDPESLLGTTDLQKTEFAALPYQDKARASWVAIQDENNRTVARYAYWVEDLQGRIDPGVCGNHKGPGETHARKVYPFPAPGLAELPFDPFGTDVDNQVALYAVDPAATETQQGTAGKNLIKNRAILQTPDSALAAAGLAPPLAREPSGHLADPKARALEESLAPGLRAYEEQPLVPHAEGFSPAVAGQPKLNLNRLLAKDRSAAVNEMADFIKKALPNFDSRKGGFPDDYLKTLAANALDYADTDSEPSVVNGSYRGLDAYPLVSEFLMRFRWENVREVGGRKLLVLSASTYVELWNLSDKDVSGQAEVSFETKYKFPLGANPEVSLDDMSVASPKLVEKNGYRWFPARAVSLKPNEYLLIKCGTITYEIDAGPASFFIPSPLVLEGETFGVSGAGYRLMWNGKLVDQSRGGVHRNNCSLNYPTDTTSKPSQRTRTTIPAHSMTRNGSFRNNMGDCRMSCYYGVPQDANVYPDNFSPNRRNIRWGTIYKGDVATKTKVYGRVMPSEWPDGGHNSPYDSNGFYTTDERVLPDDPRFFPPPSSVLRNPAKEEAPMRLSNLGRFFSATELGRVYDPIMWEVAMPSGPNLPWGDVLSTTTASTDFGGGNSLRIGRPEHPKFNLPDVSANSPSSGMEAWRLLDLFHAGIGNSEVAAEREGNFRTICGHVNLNTAGRDVLRALAVGALTMDPKMSLRSSENHDTSTLMAPPVTPYKLSPAEINEEANRIADAIILARKAGPFTSAALVAEVLDASGKPVFGNKDMLPGGKGPQVHRTDSAAEEIFARVYESSTVRSRNFRIWVVGQSIAPLAAGASGKPEVLAEVRRCFTVFAQPGERTPDGGIRPGTSQLEILHESDF